MRRGLTWLVSLPLVLAATETGHVLAYRLVYPDAHVRLRALLASGHGYLRYAPCAVACAAAVLLASLLVAVADTARGRPPRALPPWAFALLPALTFVLQEHVERWLQLGVFPWFTVRGPTFLPGLALQVPFGLAAWLVARLLLRTATEAGRALAPAPPRLVAWPRLPRPASVPAPPRRRPLALKRAGRAPPAVALA